MQRLTELVRAEIARILRDECHDPRIGLLSVTRVEMTRDLSCADVFWSPLDVAQRADVTPWEEGLAAAAGFVRSRLAGNLDLRKTPALRFHYDPAIEEGRRTLDILRRLGEESSTGADEDGEEA